MRADCLRECLTKKLRCLFDYLLGQSFYTILCQYKELSKLSRTVRAASVSILV